MHASENCCKKEDFEEVLEESFHEEVGGVMQIIGQHWFDEGEKQGLQQGLQQGLALAVLAQLEWRFGQIHEMVEKRIRTLPAERLKDLNIALLSFKQPSDLPAWLDRQIKPDDLSC
jgi:Domain of unknown function (DUF4351)